MPKKARVRTLMGSQHVKVSEAHLKSALQYICHFFWSPWKEISLKNSVLVVSEILRMFVNILRQDDVYSVPVKESI